MSNPLETDSLEADVVPAQMQIGVALKSAREQRNMTVQDVCTHLRISPHQVNALESDDFTALPEATLTRGFIRNYARLLGIDAEPLLQDFRAFMPATAPYALTIKPERTMMIADKDKRPWLKYIVVSIFIFFFLGAWEFYMDYTPEPPVRQIVLPAKDTDAHTDTDENTGAGLSSTAIKPLIKGAVKTTAKLKLSFSQISWVDVTDRNKIMIFAKIMPAGSEEIVEGEPPLEVVVGNASGSKLVFNDKSVDLAPYTKANVARVTLE